MTLKPVHLRAMEAIDDGLTTNRAIAKRLALAQSTTHNRLDQLRQFGYVDWIPGRVGTLHVTASGVVAMRNHAIINARNGGSALGSVRRLSNLQSGGKVV